MDQVKDVMDSFRNQVREYRSTHFRLDSRYTGINPPQDIYLRNKPIDNDWLKKLESTLYSFVTFEANDFNWFKVHIYLSGLFLGKPNFLIDRDLRP